jgi:hypothetical protein
MTTTPKGQINAPDQLDCMSTLRCDANNDDLTIAYTAGFVDGRKKADAEIECLRKANLDCVAHYDDARAECERHIQEVDASREAIDRKDAALRMALDAIEGTYIGWRGEKSGEAITTIKEALS